MGLTLADVDEKFPRALAQHLGRPAKVTTTALDASDPKALQRAMDGVALVIQASLPRFNQNVQGAALAVGAHYMDLAADSADPYTRAEEWRQRGLTALIGMGEDPGLSNVLARRAADGMERVDSIKIRDGDTATSPDHVFLPLFSPETFIEETLTASRIWDGGKYRSVPPFGEGETYEFPDPVGPQKVYSVDHEEVDSLPRFIGKGVRYVDFKLALDDVTVRSLEALRDLKLLARGTPEAPGPRRAVLQALPKPADLAGKVDGYAALVVETTGEAAGGRRRETLFTLLNHRVAFDRYGATATAYLTGTPAAVGALLIVEGAIRVRGAVPPEALDPEPFFPKLAERGILVTERSTIDRPLGVA
jgi:saccharopine dehydrogenase (NAD+, L-lysine forming)